MSGQVTGAADWRSESEKRKSILRKACIALFKTWIPDHPEASMAREGLPEFPGFDDGLQRQHRHGESVLWLRRHVCPRFSAQPLSMQELLVQREGTDAFLDPKNALRVVRRKFGMMTLISRMSSTFEQRNVIAVRLKSGISQEELVQFGRAFGTRVEGTAAEEEIELKKRLKTTPCPHVDVLYHSDLVGRRAPVPWPVKEVYSVLGRRYRRRRNIPPEELTAFAHESVKRLNAKALRQLSIYADELSADLDAGGLDPYAELVKAADGVMLTTRSIFDEFREIRAQQRRNRGTDSPKTPRLLWRKTLIQTIQVTSNLRLMRMLSLSRKSKRRAVLREKIPMSTSDSRRL